MSIVIGQNIAEQGRRISWSRQTGYDTERVFIAEMQAALGIMYSFQAPGEADTVELIDNQNGTATILARYNTDGSSGQTEEAPTTLWEIVSNTGEKSIYEHPRTLTLPLEVIQAIRTAVDNNGDPPYTPVGGNATWLYDRAGKGQDKYFFASYAVRLTQTVGNTFSQQISDNNVLNIYTTAQLFNEAQGNGTPIPARLRFKLENIPTQTATGFVWGYLKQPSTENQVGGGKIQIITEWILELWDALTYTPKP